MAISTPTFQSINGSLIVSHLLLNLPILFLLGITISSLKVLLGFLIPLVLLMFSFLSVYLCLLYNSNVLEQLI